MAGSSFCLEFEGLPRCIIVPYRSLRALERGGASNAEHEELFNAARTAGLENPEDYMEIFLARLDYLRRSVSSTKDELWEKFESASEDIQVTS